MKKGDIMRFKVTPTNTPYFVDGSLVQLNEEMATGWLCSVVLGAYTANGESIRQVFPDDIGCLLYAEELEPLEVIDNQT